jgi:hypothetical protein
LRSLGGYVCRGSVAKKKLICYSGEKRAKEVSFMGCVAKKKLIC